MAPSSDEQSTQTDNNAVPSNVYIELARLSPRSRSKYSSVMDTFIPPESEPQRVVGEHMDYGVPCYFAEHTDGTVYKYDSVGFTKDYPKLVEDYVHKKTAGAHSPFSPSTNRAHPDFGLINTNGPTRDENSAYELPSNAESSGEGEEWEDDVPEASLSESMDSDTSSSRIIGDRQSPAPRYRTRQASKHKTLPFSPKRVRLRSLRQRHRTTVNDTSHTSRAGIRHSNRLRNDTQSYSYTSPIAVDSSSSSEIERESSRNKVKGVTRLIRRTTTKGPLPIYGNFFDVSDINRDYIDDDSTTTLRAHRDTCEKCARPPTHVLMVEQTRRGRAKKREEDEDLLEQVGELGGWVRCLKCPLAAHWMCLASTQRNEILKAARNKNIDSGSSTRSLNNNQATMFLCSTCIKGGTYLCCVDKTVDSIPSASSSSNGVDAISHGTAGQDPFIDTDDLSDIPADELLFSCVTCKRIAHYAHLPVPEGNTLDPEDAKDRASLAEIYQMDYGWNCHDCVSYTYRVDKILAWRPVPNVSIQQQSQASGQTPPQKSVLPREYLVKWQGRSYRRTSWVHHGWIAATHASLLRSFLSSGPRVTLLSHSVTEREIANDTAEGGVGSIESESQDYFETHGKEKISGPPSPCADADRRIPPAWRTVDRVLDVQLFNAQPDDTTDRIRDNTFACGEQPDDQYLESIEDFESRSRRKFTDRDIDRIIWVFVKWDDLGYEEATWDSPPLHGQPGYNAFKFALRRFLHSRSVKVSKLTSEESRKRHSRPKDMYRHKYSLSARGSGQPDLGQATELKLLPFQLDGFDWLCDNWWNHQPCILADDMGLGKTIQICAFVGSIIKRWEAWPILIVVPNSTITNWAREFNRWAPELRVVPFYGEAKARDVIKRYELFHSHAEKGTTGAKYHVLVTTYNTITNSKDFGSVFKSQPRWEALIVDEGQRLNNDSSLLFKKLNELRVYHRVIMTGTPLNNNIRELFSLLNFLDPDQWSDLKQLEKDYVIKAEVLKLPPKNEVIVPVSLTPFQKEAYKSILSKNVNLLMNIAKSTTSSVAKTRASTTVATKANLNNMLMQLRKCIQHPYLLSPEIEPIGLSKEDTHAKLIGASSKLCLLQSLLPKLKSRGHRVLLFSQFVIALDVIEDFLIGEHYKYLRLDGNTKQANRQKDMDEFNQPNSNIFIYLLSTRAGGVGINLWSADTVIIFDPDFNPHQDLQAIARAHRYGQTKPCLVFKLMAKDTAEERIIQSGKKKLVLDHLIVQKINDDEAGTDVQSILTYGAKTLFEDEQRTREITYSDQDLDALIDRTESCLPQEEPDNEPSHAFSFAKIWTADKKSLEEIPESDGNQLDQANSWNWVLQQLEEEQKKRRATELSGRGVRRKATAMPLNAPLLDPEISPVRAIKTKGRKKAGSDSDEWAGCPASTDSETESTGEGDAVFGSKPLGAENQETTEDQRCGLCNSLHVGPCEMLESSENLVMYRLLLCQSSDEPFDRRRAAMDLIDETLSNRGHTHLIQGQPLVLIPPRVQQCVPSGTISEPSTSTAVPNHLYEQSSMTHAHVPRGRSQHVYSDSFGREQHDSIGGSERSPSAKRPRISG